VRYSFLRKTPADASICKIFLFGHIAMPKAAPNLKSRSCHAVQRPTRYPRHASRLSTYRGATNSHAGSSPCDSNSFLRFAFCLACSLSSLVPRQYTLFAGCMNSPPSTSPVSDILSSGTDLDRLGPGRGSSVSIRW